MRMTEQEFAALQANRTRQPVKAQPTAQQAMYALGRLPDGTLNKTEQAYQDQLEAMKHAGQIVWYMFEAINLRLAKRTHYRPDFLVLLASGEFEVHEVKGRWTDDARVKIKVAASMYPFRFIAVRKVKGEFVREVF